MTSRRRFLRDAPLMALAAIVTVDTRSLLGRTLVGPGHPEPRAGIDASKVLTSDQLVNPAVAPIFDMVREIPQIADGIRCNCGCAELEGFYSLLSCYEAGGMAQFCEICQGQATLAYRRHQEGQTLDRIRNAIDARFGSAG
ncbi:MAG: PCYCGC domain-containing protein [Gemmatimonadota bacterium]|nr:PCYCGC domain-containing protein [Gemmatimonadota bacterium]MDH5759043.1 PCYCGC domain-containing protein [Gemmatimonadota bacterium]